VLEQTEIRQMALVNANEAAMLTEDARHKKALAHLKELLDKGAEANAVLRALDEENALHKSELQKLETDALVKRLDVWGEINRAYEAGEVERFIGLLDLQSESQLASLDERRQFLEAYKDFWIETHRTMFSYVAEGSKVIAGGISDAIVDVVLQTKSAAEVFKSFGLSSVWMFATRIVNRAIAFLAEKVLHAVGLGLAAAQSKAMTVIAAGLAAAWAPAATASLIATYGASASAAGLLAPLMAANSAAAAGLSLAGGAAHSGLDYVPADSTFLLQQGERVVQRNQNEQLTDFLDGRGGGTTQVNIYLDGQILSRSLGQMSRDGRLEISAKAIT
jgi:hypothetical protein